MSKPTAIIYGSGASRGSGYLVSISHYSERDLVSTSIAPPTDQEFFCVLPDEYIKNSYPALWYFKNEYYPGNQRRSMENIWTDVDINHKHITLNTYNWSHENSEYKNKYISRYPLSDIDNRQFIMGGFLGNYPSFTTSPIPNRYKFLGDCGRDFRRLIYNVYGNYSKHTGVDNYKQLHEVISGSQYAVSAYITFNYDCFIEESLIEEPLKYIGTNDRTDSYESLKYGGIPIIKLHGSLNWEYKHNGIEENVTYRAFPYSAKSQVVPKYDNENEWVEPAIIPPTIFKQEINDDSRINHPLTKTILQQWRAAITVLTEADLIIIVGYSFPTADHHVSRIFNISNMIRRRSGKEHFKILYCCGPNDDLKEIETKIYKILNPDIELIVVKEFENLVGNSDFIRIIR